MRRNTPRITKDGRPANWIGANFWSRAGGPLMWRSYDPELIRQELSVLASHGLTMTRSFFYWPDFMPAPDQIDETMVARFADFLDRHAEQHLSTIPTFIVGHMSGENWDPAWRDGRHLYKDVWLVDRQAWFAGEMTRRFKDHPAVAGWLVSNEMPIYGGDDTEHETVAAWARIIKNAVRAAGGHHPFSLGDGAWGIEVSGRDNGFRLTDIAEITDFLGPHTYPVGDDPVRQRYAAAMACELSGTFGLPVIMEEFGVSSDFASEANAAVYYRHVLWNTLLAGSTGWIGWNNTDFALPTQEPYLHHAFELNFGLTDASGTPKETLREMKAFARTLERMDFGRCDRADTDTALIVSSYLDTAYPFTSPDSPAAVSKGLHQSYLTARLADLPPKLTREATGIEPGAKLYLAPSVKQVLATTASSLEQLADDGACVYVSYSAGDVAWHRGPSYGRMNDLFGVRHQLDVGLTDRIQDEIVQFTFTRDFGGLTQGTTLTFRVAGSQHSRSYLPVEPVAAEVIATDAHGRPALLRKAKGAGSLILCTYPLEYMAAVTPRADTDPLVALYGALATDAGVRRHVTVTDPQVTCDLLIRDDGARFAVLTSHAAEPVTVKPLIDGGDFRGTLVTLDGDEVTDGVNLGRFGIMVCEIMPSAKKAGLCRTLTCH
ncbi:MAG TPA: cellulase family glycosylhydrolase [Trebonia sp.]|nr:cellulase family glycosylhydrolase [Trebonia sp.]